MQTTFANISKIKNQIFNRILDSKAHGANMGPIWGGQDPGGPNVGPMNFAIWDMTRLALVPAIACCRQATSHNLNQYKLKSMTSYFIIRPQSFSIASTIRHSINSKYVILF